MQDEQVAVVGGADVDPHPIAAVHQPLAELELDRGLVGGQVDGARRGDEAERERGERCANDAAIHGTS